MRYLALTLLALTLLALTLLALTLLVLALLAGSIAAWLYKVRRVCRYTTLLRTLDEPDRRTS